MRACVLAAVVDPWLLALRRAGAGSGQFRPSNRSTIMSQLSLSLDTPLMVRDGRGRYRPADADQILEAARQVIEQKMQRGAIGSAACRERVGPYGLIQGGAVSIKKKTNITHT